MAGGGVLFEIRAERADPLAKLWTWAMYRPGASKPMRRSMPMFETDMAAIEAGNQVVAEIRRRATHANFVRQGV